MPPKTARVAFTAAWEGSVAGRDPARSRGVSSERKHGARVLLRIYSPRLSAGVARRPWGRQRVRNGREEPGGKELRGSRKVGPQWGVEPLRSKGANLASLSWESVPWNDTGLASE